MVPDLDLQLQVAIKALADTIAPAVDPANKVAMEQLNLTVATLTMVRNRLPLARRFSRRLLEDQIAMAEAVSKVVPLADMADGPALGDAIRHGRDMLLDPEADTQQLENVRSILTEMTTLVIAQVQDSGSAALLDRIVLDASKRSIERCRAWCLPAGFEPYPTQVAAIEVLL